MCEVVKGCSALQHLARAPLKCDTIGFSVKVPFRRAANTARLLPCTHSPEQTKQHLPSSLLNSTLSQIPSSPRKFPSVLSDLAPDSSHQIPSRLPAAQHRGLLKTFVLETAPNSWKSPERVSMYDLGSNGTRQSCNQPLYNIRLAGQEGFFPTLCYIQFQFVLRQQINCSL